MLATDDDILAAAEAWRRAGRGVALATVVETWGSAPRPVGSHLVVDAEGDFLGSVSGGCVEGDVVTEAMDVIADGAPAHAGVRRRRRDRVARGPELRRQDPRLRRAGRPMRLDLLSALNAERAARRAAVVVTELATGAQRLVRAADAAADPLAEPIAEALRSGRSGTVAAGDGPAFLSVQVPPVRLVVIGAVHVSQALAPMARLAGLDVTVVDPRTAFATPERFPDVTLLAEWPDAALARLGLDRFTAVAALTHDPKIDDPGLDAALRAECFYVGALGSRKTHAARVARLLAAGHAEGAIARIRAPIGLDIGAVSPAEIAVSVLGEVVGALRRKPTRAERGDAATATVVPVMAP